LPAQPGVALGRVEVETVAVRGEEGDVGAPLGPVPAPSEKAFDQTELRRHRAGSRLLIAACTAASISARLRPGGITGSNRKVTRPGHFTKALRGQTRPLSSATGATVRPSAR